MLETASHCVLCVRLPFQVICGLNHTLCLGKDSKVYACGWSTDGQTGILPCSFYTLSNTFPINIVPVPISLLLRYPHTHSCRCGPLWECFATNSSQFEQWRGFIHTHICWHFVCPHRSDLPTPNFFLGSSFTWDWFSIPSKWQGVWLGQQWIWPTWYTPKRETGMSD